MIFVQLFALFLLVNLITFFSYTYSYSYFRHFSYYYSYSKVAN